MCFQQVISFSKGLLTPIIAVIAAFIAYKQWYTNAQKLKLDLFNRRFRVYEETIKILRLILRNLKPNQADLQNFYEATLEADFLFKPEVRQYLDEICNHAAILNLRNIEYNDQISSAPIDADHKRENIRNPANEKQEEYLWFNNQFGRDFEPVKNIFKKYLNVSKLH